MALINAGHEPKIEVKSTPGDSGKSSRKKLNLSLGEQFYLTTRLRSQRSMTMTIYRYIKDE